MFRSSIGQVAGQAQPALDLITQESLFESRDVSFQWSLRIASADLPDCLVKISSQSEIINLGTTFLNKSTGEHLTLPVLPSTEADESDSQKAMRTNELERVQAVIKSDDSWQPLITSNVDPATAALPGDQLDFKSLYEAHRKFFYPAGPYHELVQSFAAIVLAKCGNERPDCFVTIPSRCEPDTARTSDVILEDCINSDITPFIIVLHNDIADPDPVTVNDLDILRRGPNSVVLDLKVDKDFTVGCARRLLADVVFEVIYTIQTQAESRFERIPELILADADIWKATPGTYQSLLRPLQADPNVDYVTSGFRFAPESIAADKPFAIIQSLQNVFDEAVESLIGKESEQKVTVGALTAINTSRLLTVGGLSRLKMAEDHLVGMKFKQVAYALRGNQPCGIVLTRDRACVYVGAERFVNPYRRFDIEEVRTNPQIARYENWDEESNRLRGEPSAVAANPAEYVQVIQAAIDQLSDPDVLSVFDAEVGLEKRKWYLNRFARAIDDIAEVFMIPTESIDTTQLRLAIAPDDNTVLPPRKG